MNVDINQTVRIKLTTEGNEFLEKNGYSYKIENGCITTQLWDLMEVFGSEMGMFSSPMFEHNIIEFVDLPVQNETIDEKVERLERRINTFSETLRTQNNSINIQAKNIHIMRNAIETQGDTIKTQCGTIETLVQMVEKLRKIDP